MNQKTTKKKPKIVKKDDKFIVFDEKGERIKAFDSLSDARDALQSVVHKEKLGDTKRSNNYVNARKDNETLNLLKTTLSQRFQASRKEAGVKVEENKGDE